MIQKYRVLWAEAAEKDLSEIIDYIAIENPGSALETLQKIKKGVSGLYSLPERGRVVPELYEQGILLYRELIVSPWRIVYRVADGDVYVLSVFDSRRNVEDILLNRLVDL